MKDSQQGDRPVVDGFKYIKVNNERFSTRARPARQPP